MINPPTTQRPYLRVAFATPSLAMGGAERWIISLAKSMRAMRVTAIGHFNTPQHHAICEEASRICPIYSVADIPYAQKLDSPYAVAQKLIDNADVIVTWGIGNTINLFGQCGKPIVDVSHNEAKFEEHKKLLTGSWQGATHLVGISEAAARGYPEKCHPEVHVIYNGIEVDRVAPRRSRADMRKKHGIAEDAKIMLFLGRLSPFKHPELLIRALAHLDESWIAAFVGAGEEQYNLERDAGYIGNRRVRFFPVTTHVGDFYNMADAFILPSEYEGFPLAMIESWMAGLPVVCTPFACTSELQALHGDVFKLLPDRPRPEDLATAVQEVIAAGGNRSEMAIRARSVAWANYTAAAMAYRWEAYLAWVIRNWQDVMLETVSQARDKVSYQSDYL